MRLVFMGTPDFAVPALKTLAEHHDVVAAITAPDKPAGRGKKLSASAVKEAAEALTIPLLQPVNLKDPDFQNRLKSLNADLFVVVAFRMLPEAVWAMPPKGTINLHASILPNYRGAAPIHRAIMDGQTETGLTTFFIEKDIDTGMIIEQVKLKIGENENVGQLHDRMMQSGAALLLSTVDKIEAGTTHPVRQEELFKSSEVRLAPKIFREDCEINWSMDTISVHNHIRGLSPYPAAWTPVFADGTAANESYKIFAAIPAENDTPGKPGDLLTDSGRLLAKTGDGWIEILSLQVPGKKRVDTADFLRGFRIPEGWSFSR